jgi:hypothetical protein
MAAELGWDSARTTREIADYTARATAELAAEQTENDTEAEAEEDSRHIEIKPS